MSVVKVPRRELKEERKKKIKELYQSRNRQKVKGNLSRL